MKTQDITKIKYYCPKYMRKASNKASIEPIGLDTEAYTTGECFLICTSYGDSFKPIDFPRCLFSRLYRNTSFVCYNLKYDSGAFIQQLPFERISELRKFESTEHNGYLYKIIGYKCLTIVRGKNAIHIYDIAPFYEMSLRKAAKKYLQIEKIDLDPGLFIEDYVKKHYESCVSYCIQDALLTAQLAALLIKRFESYGIHPQKLYSIAYISYQYFRSKCPNVVVKKYWDNYKDLLSFALQSYYGGKFEVTRKGPGYFYEYDLVSAYPAVIHDLIDISWARTVHEKKYRKFAVYGFLHCKIKIPFSCVSPVPVKRGIVNCYCIGEFEKIITKVEYEYLIDAGCDITIIDAWYLCCDNKQYPYRKAIKDLVKLKAHFKETGAGLDYHTVKIIMNSFYGKMIQLIKKEEHYEASACWNPIYGAHITATVRVQVSNVQALYPQIHAVHTDSVLSTVQLPHIVDNSLGGWIETTEGSGVILGSGIYQVGEKVKFRGLQKNISILDLLKNHNKKLIIDCIHAYSWKEIVFRGWDKSKINLFDIVPKKVDVNFDQKRVWLNDYKDWSEVMDRNVESVPFVFNPTFF